MRILERLTLLVKADAHGVLEHLEERALLARQHLREAELELDRKRARADALDEEIRGLGDEAARLDGEIDALDEDVELALGGGKEELARFAVRRLLPRRRAAEAARRRRAELETRRARLRETLALQEGQLEELRARVQAELATGPEPDADARGPATDRAWGPVAADEEVELELLRRRRARADHDEVA